MFSSRTRWDLSINRLAALLEEQRIGGSEIADLTESNPTRVGLPYPEKEILGALADSASLGYEPSTHGLPAAREAVTRVYADRGLRVAPEDLFLTASSSEAYAWIFKLLMDPADEVLVPRPSYPLFEFLARLETVTPVPYPLVYDGSWSIDFSSLAGKLSPRTRAVVVVSPNNPTGSYLKRDELARLSSICSEKGMALIGDEVFAEYPAGPDPSRAAGVLEEEGILSLSLGGLSKLAGLPQFKLGWIALGGPPDLRRGARERLELIADTYLSVNTPVQQAAPVLLDLAKGIRREIARRISRNRRALEEATKKFPCCRALTAEGGWYVVLEVPAVLSEEEWVLTLLEQDHVLAHPGYFFDFPSPAHLVLSLLPPERIFQTGLERILRRASLA